MSKEIMNMDELNEAIVKSAEVVSLYEKLVKGVKAVFSKGKDNDPVVILENKRFAVKETEHGLRWFAAYSNMYEDRDGEIITSASHNRFVKMVDNGDAPYPELWVWHIPGTRIGIADWIEFDSDTGFALASGLFDEGREKIGKSIASLDKIAVSHGMPNKTIKRDPINKGHIIEHESEEISPLLLWAAANQLTDFETFKEDKSMSISKEKKDLLIAAGFPQEEIDVIEASLTKASEQAKEDFEFKEKKDVDAEDTEDTQDDDKIVADDDEDIITDEVHPDVLKTLEAITLTSEALASNLKEITERLDAIENDQKEVNKEVKDAIDSTPSSSLAGLIARNFSAVGNPDTSVRKNSKLAGDGPEENEDKSVAMDVPQQIIASIFSGNK